MPTYRLWKFTCGHVVNFVKYENYPWRATSVEAKVEEAERMPLDCPTCVMPVLTGADTAGIGVYTANLRLRLNGDPPLGPANTTIFLAILTDVADTGAASWTGTTCARLIAAYGEQQVRTAWTNIVHRAYW